MNDKKLYERQNHYSYAIGTTADDKYFIQAGCISAKGSFVLDGPELYDTLDEARKVATFMNDYASCTNDIRTNLTIIRQFIKSIGDNDNV